MEHFPHLKCLYFEGNAVVSLDGLQLNRELVSLYMHENCIRKMEHLSTLQNLKILNLADNCIERIEGLEGLQLDTLYLARNRIGWNGIEDLKGLLPEIFEKMPELRVLYLLDNKFAKGIKNYRKTMTVKLPKLSYLDDRPVFAEDRRHAEAFTRGGIEEERKERETIKQENNARDEKNR